MPKAITLDSDGTVRVEEYDGCKSIYSVIGRSCSTFECLPCPGLPGEVFVDEEGKMNGQPVNVFASDLLRAHRCIFPQDYICGKIMFVGYPDEQGKATDVDPELEQIVREHMAKYAAFQP